MQRRSFFNQRRKPSVHADLIPMIDIIFQLVVFFMLTSTFSQLPAIKIDLPKSSTAQMVEIESIVFSITEQNRYFCNDKEMSLAEIELFLQSIPIEQRSQQKILLKGDQKSALGAFVSLLDLLRKNGFDQYALPVTVENQKKND